MAKKKPKLVKVSFVTDSGVMVIPDVEFKSFAGRPGCMNFMHLEMKGGKWFLLQNEGAVFDENLGHLKVIRTTDKLYRPCFLTPDDRPLAVSRYTVITPLTAAPFYYLDELPDHTYRLCHSTSFFTGASWVTPHSKGGEHEHVLFITVEAVE